MSPRTHKSYTEFTIAALASASNELAVGNAISVGIALDTTDLDATTTGLVVQVYIKGLDAWVPLRYRDGDGTWVYALVDVSGDTDVEIAYTIPADIHPWPTMRLVAVSDNALLTADAQAAAVSGYLYHSF